jgi:hypothetical protein
MRSNGDWRGLREPTSGRGRRSRAVARSTGSGAAASSTRRGLRGSSSIDQPQWAAPAMSVAAAHAALTFVLGRPRAFARRPEGTRALHFVRARARDCGCRGPARDRRLLGRKARAGAFQPSHGKPACPGPQARDRLSRAQGATRDQGEAREGAGASAEPLGPSCEPALRVGRAIRLGRARPDPPHALDGRGPRHIRERRGCGAKGAGRARGVAATAWTRPSTHPAHVRPVRKAYAFEPDEFAAIRAGDLPRLVRIVEQQLPFVDRADEIARDLNANVCADGVFADR